MSAREYTVASDQAPDIAYTCRTMMAAAHAYSAWHRSGDWTRMIMTVTREVDGREYRIVAVRRETGSIVLSA